jgi:hypothetical protein
MAEARFHDACDALRAKLREMMGHTHNSGTEPSAVGLAALRVVLQHSCQADCEMLSARRDCPDQCYVVTCDVDRNEFWLHGDHVYKDIYSPALTSKENAWRLCAEMAHNAMENTPDPDIYELDFSHEEDGPSYHVSAANSFSKFSVATYDLCGGTIEDAETFLDLRALAALRVVAGPDKSLTKVFNTVVSFRETKMPRTLYAEVPEESSFYLDDDFHFSALRVDKCGGPRSGASVNVLYSAEVLKAAATVYVKHRKAKKKARYHGATPPAIPHDLKYCVDATADKPFDTAVVYNLSQEPRQVAMRPLPLVEDAFADYEPGVMYYSQQTKPTLKLFGIHHHGPMGENNMRTLRQYAKDPRGFYVDGVYM